MKTLSTLIGMGMGALIWAFAPMITGHKEPWDGSPALYFGMLFVAGAICAIPNPRAWWTGVIGIYVGQWAYVLLIQGGGNLWFIGMIIGAIFMIPAVGGGLLVWCVWEIARRALAIGSKPQTSNV